MPVAWSNRACPPPSKTRAYILDARRRADADRERGTVPDIHARPAPPLPGEGSPTRGAQSALRWGLIAAAALALMAALWWALGGREASRDVGAAAPVAMPAPPPAAVPVTPTALPAAMPEARTTALPAPPSATRPAPESATPQRTAAPVAAAAPAVASAASSAGGTTRLYAASELPAEVRRELPPLAIGGAIYSPSAANRMLIVNGQLLREGDAAARDVTIEQIKPKSAVLRFKGYRYEVAY